MSSNIPQEKLISLVEQSTLERDKAINTLSNLQVENLNLKNSNLSLMNENQKNMNIILNNKTLVDNTDKKIKEYINKLMENEKEITDISLKCERYENENLNLKYQLDYYKNMYKEMENRKNNEITCLRNLLNEKEKENEKLKKNNEEYQEKLNDLNLKISLNNMENEKLKIDNDKLLTIIDSNNDTVNLANIEKNNIDKMKRNFEKEKNNLILENDKLLNKIKILNEEKEKNSLEYESNIKKNNENFIKNLNEVKDNYENILKEKFEDFNNLKGDYISMKLDRDKYLSDYKILENDYKNLNDNYKLDYEKNLKSNHDNQINNKKLELQYQDKIKLLYERNSFLESENEKLTKEIESYSGIKNLQGKLAKNDLEINNEINNIRNENKKLLEKNEELESDYNNLQLKYKNLLANCDLRVNTYELTFKDMNDRNIEENIKKLLKEQEEITGKLKEHINENNKNIAFISKFE